MPHFTIEYSASLEDRADIQLLCDTVHAAAQGCGLFELGAIRVRALRAEAVTIADALPRNAFVHLTVSVGAGRDKSALASAGESIWVALLKALAPAFETPHFALSMEWREIDPDLSWKKNAIHPRIRAAQGTTQ